MTVRTAAQWLECAQRASPMPMLIEIDGTRFDPVFGDLEATVLLWRTVQNDDTQLAARELSIVIGDFLRDATGEPEITLNAEWRVTAMRMAVPAVLLDLPLMEALVDRFPSTLHTPVDKDLLSTLHQSDGPAYSLYGLAFRHSMPEAMDKLAALVLKHCDKPGVELGLGWSYDAEKPFGRFFDVTTMAGHVKNTFLPSALVAAVGHLRILPGHGQWEEDTLAEMAINALIRDDTPDFRTSVLAFLALGLYEHDVAHSFQMACMHGHAAVLKSFEGRAPWDKMGIGSSIGNSQFMFGLEGAKNLAGEVRASWYEDALLEVVRQAVADGRPALVFRKLEDEKNGWVTVEPVQSILEVKFNRLLVQFLDHGWDPRVPALPGAKTMLQMAREVGNADAPAIMTSHVARRHAHSLLDEIGPHGTQAFRVMRVPRTLP